MKFREEEEFGSKKTYPDFGCSFETFTNNDFLEIETLGPLTKVLPGQTVEQVEHWGLYPTWC